MYGIPSKIIVAKDSFLIFIVIIIQKNRKKTTTKFDNEETISMNFV